MQTPTLLRLLTFGTSRVQQGLIFLSMTSANLIRDTKIYEKVSKTTSSSPSLSRASGSPLNEGLTLLESLHDPEVASRHEHNAVAAVAALDSLSEWPFPFDTSGVSDASYHRHVNPRPASSSRENGIDEDFHYDWPLTEPETRTPALAVTVSNDSGSDVDFDNDLSPVEIASRLRRHGNSGRMRRPLAQRYDNSQSDHNNGETDYETGAVDRNSFLNDIDDEVSFSVLISTVAVLRTAKYSLIWPQTFFHSHPPDSLRI